jgi:cytochrome P450 PksS
VEWSTDRYNREPVTYAGVTIPAREHVVLVIGSANRDEAQFPGADALDLGREPNRHLAFGHGIHYCLGAPLARLEGQVAFRTLLDRCAEVKLAVPYEQLKWRNGVLLRGLRSLPVRVAGAQSRRTAA